jgi:hypothetical protein
MEEASDASCSRNRLNGTNKVVAIGGDRDGGTSVPDDFKQGFLVGLGLGRTTSGKDFADPSWDFGLVVGVKGGNKGSAMGSKDGLLVSGRTVAKVTVKTLSTVELSNIFTKRLRLP